MDKMKMACDLGYSSLKVTIDGEKQLIPSVMVKQQEREYTKPADFNTDEERMNYINHLLEQMDVTISSPAIESQGRFLVGKRALESGIYTETFDINGLKGKSEEDLSMILILSTIANQTVINAIKNDGELDKNLKITVDLSTALPIVEGKRPNIIENYSKRFLNGKHYVTLQNFAQPITVEITFERVFVGLEGTLAQFAIANAQEKGFKTSIKKEFDKAAPELKDEMNIDAIINLQNILGIDVGEGTTDFAVIANNTTNTQLSDSMNAGYGSVLQDAVTTLQQAGYSVANRSALNRYLSQTNISPIQRQKYEYVKRTTLEQLDKLVNRIIDKTSQIMQNITNSGESMDIIFVYGGGSVPLNNASDLQGKLQNKIKEFYSGFSIPVVFIDKAYAQRLNEMGLELTLNVGVGKTLADFND